MTLLGNLRSAAVPHVTISIAEGAFPFPFPLPFPGPFPFPWTFVFRCKTLCHSPLPECVPLVCSQAARFRTYAACICPVELLEIPQVMHPHPADLAGIRAKYAGELVGKLDSIWTDEDMHPVLFTLEGAQPAGKHLLIPL